MMKHSTIWARATKTPFEGVLAALAFGAVLALCAGLGSALTPAPARTNRAPASLHTGRGDGPKWMAPASASAKKNPLAASEATFQTGKRIYGKECASCHGKKGVGDGPKAGDLTKEPGNFTTKEFASQSDGAIFWKMTKGNKPMPTFATAYTDEERWSVVNYLRTLCK